MAQDCFSRPIAVLLLYYCCMSHGLSIRKHQEASHSIKLRIWNCTLPSRYAKAFVSCQPGIILCYKSLGLLLFRKALMHGHISGFDRLKRPSLIQLWACIAYSSQAFTSLVDIARETSTGPKQGLLLFGHVAPNIYVSRILLPSSQINSRPRATCVVFRKGSYGLCCLCPIESF